MRCVFYLKTGSYQSMVFTIHDLESVSRYALSLLLGLWQKQKSCWSSSGWQSLDNNLFFGLCQSTVRKTVYKWKKLKKIASLPKDRSPNKYCFKINKFNNLWGHFWTTKGSFTLANVIFIVATHCSPKTAVLQFAKDHVDMLLNKWLMKKINKVIFC